MRFLLTILLTFLGLTFSASGQNFSSGQKALMIVTYKDSIVKAEVNGKPKIKIRCKSHSEYYWYSLNAIHHSQGAIDGKALHGKYQVYSINNDLKSKGKFCRGRKYGKFYSWRTNGKLLSIQKFRKGRLQGKSCYYDSTGALTSTTRFCNGLKWGWEKNYVNGKVIAKIKYKKGKIVPAKEPKNKLVKEKKKKSEGQPNTASNENTPKEKKVKKKKESTPASNKEKNSFFSKIFAKKDKKEQPKK